MTRRSWQPRPRRRPELLIAACGMAAIVGVGLVLAAVLEIRDQREWAAVNDRMTEEQIQTLRELAAERVPEEIRFQQPSHPATGMTATWYGGRYDGRRTASGTVFNSEHLTAAHVSLPFGTRLRVAHEGRIVDVTVTDRMPAGPEAIDLSAAAFRAIAPLAKGRIRVQVRRLS